MPGYRGFAGRFGSFPIDLSMGRRIFPSSSRGPPAADRPAVAPDRLCDRSSVADRPATSGGAREHDSRCVPSLPALGAVGATRGRRMRSGWSRAGRGRRRADLDATSRPAPVVGPTPTWRRRGAVTRRLQELGDAVAPDSHGFGLVAGVITGNLRLPRQAAGQPAPGGLRSGCPGPWRLRLLRRYSPLSRVTFGVLPTGSGRPPGLLTVCPSPPWYSRSCSARVCGSPPPPARPGQASDQLDACQRRHRGARDVGTFFPHNLFGAFLLVPRQSLADALGHKASVASMAGLAWLATSVVTWAVRWVRAWKLTRRYARRVWLSGRCAICR